LSGIPELIENDVTGVLVDSGAVDQLAEALSRLIADPALRRRLGEAGYARTTGAFSMDAGADRLAARLKACLAAA
ncbi:MAG: glycosyltransferase, partial [Betaproteobacteria bacterium]|nr:glycosyltransferase [Betaproteobacteria bacterium]